MGTRRCKRAAAPSSIGRRFTTAYLDGSTERRESAGAERIGVLRGAFGIALDLEEEARLRSIYEADRDLAP